MKELKDLNWKVLSSSYLIKDTWATIRVESCQTPDGKVVEPYYVYEFPNWVTAVAFTKDGRVILERQYRHALGKTMYEIPGGCVDASDANLEDAIARELLEETGYKFEKFDYLGSTSANPSTNTNMMHIFIAYDGECVAEQKLDAGEDLEVLFVTIEEFLELFRQGEFIQSMHTVAIYRALEKLGRLTIQ